MRTIKLILAFDGTCYAGWQRQKGQLTIQEVVEKSLSRMTSEQIILNGAGRTDAGVHAFGMAASFQTASSIPATGFQRGLNSMLPEDIRVIECSEQHHDFHARYDAIAKAYEYRLTFGEVLIPTERLYSHYLREPLDLEKVNACLKVLIGKHDFSSFEATGSRDKSKTSGKGAVRTLFVAKYQKSPNNLHGAVFTFIGDGFLRHMVRNLVGTLLEVGKGKITLEEFTRILQAKNRDCAGPTAPSRGLFLHRVFYEEDDLGKYCN